MELPSRCRHVSSSDDDDDGTIAKSEYTTLPPPTLKFFSEDKLAQYKASLLRSDVRIYNDAFELMELKTRFRKEPVVRMRYIQFNYKHPFHIMIVANANGLFITDSENFPVKQPFVWAEHLRMKHQVSFQLASATHWWHEGSRSLMTAVVNRVIEDVKGLAGTSALKEAFATRKIIPPVAFATLRKKFLTGTTVKNGKTVPDTFDVRVALQRGIPVARPQFAIINYASQLTRVHIQSCVPSKYMHAVFVITVNGFRITDGAVSIDMEVETVALKHFSPEAPLRSTDLSSDKSMSTDDW